MGDLTNPAATATVDARTAPRTVNYYAGRVATYLGVGAGLATALAPVIADTDWTSTVGILGGGAIVLGVLRKFITGAQLHEARIADPTTNIVE